MAGDPALAELAAQPVAEAARRGVVFTPALDDVLARVLGLAAAATGDRKGAITHFELALTAAEQAGARMLQARIHGDLARVHATRAAERSLASTPSVPSARRTARDGAVARAVPASPGRPRLLERVARERGAVARGGATPVRGIASGRDESSLAADLLLTREGLSKLRERVFERRGFGNVEAAAFAHREGLVARHRTARAGPSLAEISRRAPPVDGRARRGLTLFVSDIANSSELIQRLGDEAAQALIQETIA